MAGADRVELHEERVRRARALTPALRSRAEKADAERSVPRESIEEILAAGLGGRLLTPARFGGDELTLETAFDVAVELGKACGSTAWCAALLPHGTHIAAMFPEPAQQAVFADGPDPNIAASLAPAATVTPVAGGYRVTGQHHFASGVDHANWAMVSGFVDVDGKKINHHFLIPAAEFTIRDTWYAAGMRGTGSKTIVVDDVFVADGFELPAAAVIRGDGPGTATNRNVLYRQPLAVHASLTFIAPLLGVAKGAYDWFVETSKARTTQSGAQVAVSEVVQEALALAGADIDAAELLIRRILRLTNGQEPPNRDERARTIRDATRSTQLLTGAVDRLLKQSGTRAFMETSPLQRMWRDAHMMASHISFTRDNLSHFGRLALGLEPDPRMLVC